MNKVIIIFGLPGTGKSTVGTQLAQDLRYEFYDMDKVLPLEMKEKLKNNEIIQEDDFSKYLAIFIKNVTALAHKKSVVISASIFKEKHRKMLLDSIPRHILFVLDAPIEVLRTRLRERPGHFFGGALIDEAIKESDPVFAPHFSIDANQSLGKVMAEISRHLT
ncbi:hypothetical protein A3C94_02310 [Candidatus Kaiserbacteria bacterium RIFCSPHIGHO2_02_FULL_55_17]|uniref:gluconokinase n=1 Tax=Candidatus Kaiserbacteria bacterium RIFCSPHIGHO2_02_FULL_55_17 TaxID=1798496 RepID=A0A1F6DUM0_9BACT|nr:MAG: hypothetical protein A3C94_02310 [Candidatus Kaiserbacteria bacterium RIFCSPHIGHO2_02_FULL_55_17]